MTANSLQALLDQAKNPVDMLRNAQAGPYVYPVVPTEFSNWRDEQNSWTESCILFNQSYHMMDMYLEGPDALRLLTDIGVNSMKNFTIDKAKQFVACTHDGFVVGDMVLIYLGENRFTLIGRPPTNNWVQYHAEKGGYDVKFERDERAAQQSGPIRRKVYRYQVQGPNALRLMEAVTGVPTPDLKFFNVTHFNVKGHTVHALRHGMAGQAGYEIWGPWEEGDAVREAIVEAGGAFGLHQAGSRTYSSNTLESGWIPSPLPAIYEGEALRAYREWLPATGYEARASLGGSFVSENIRDYYLTPWDLGYGSFVKFDHDFIGRGALEEIAKNPRRKKVTLALDDDDVVAAIATQFGKGKQRAKYMDMPSSVYSAHPFDAVLSNGKNVGLSTWIGYSSNERRMLSLAMVDLEQAEPGTEVTLLWGEPDGGSNKPTVESHAQVEIKAIVSPVPYSEVARKSYADGWRTAQPA